MSEQRTESQEQGSATLNKEQIELIGVVLDLRLKAVVSEMRLAIKEEVERGRVEMKEEVERGRVEMKEEVEKVRSQIRDQSKSFCWFIGILVTIWLAVAVTAVTLAVNKWPQAVPVAAVDPAAPVAQVAPVGQVAPVAPDLNEPADLSQP